MGPWNLFLLTFFINESKGLDLFDLTMAASDLSFEIIESKKNFLVAIGWSRGGPSLKLYLKKVLIFRFHWKFWSFLKCWEFCITRIVEQVKLYEIHYGTIQNNIAVLHNQWHKLTIYCACCRRTIDVYVVTDRNEPTSFKIEFGSIQLMFWKAGSSSVRFDKDL
jgi:hypothetical protein